jgi:hypothetical protein
VKRGAWCRTPVDAFIAARHEEKGLTPAPEAERRVLIRRLSLDLLGLPPTPEEVDAFVEDSDPAAYDKVVERLLASPHYGERWGRHWLDVARWAESEGYESNHLRPYAWRYRDWVVKAFNDDMPFADFVSAQLAGDELQPYRDDNLIATGFVAAARLSSNEEDRWRQRNDILVDVVNATASALLGLTMQCAQCHNHKFDPISARDYYRFQGFFVRGQPVNLALRDPQLWADFRAKSPPDYEKMLDEKQELYDRAHQRRVSEARAELSREQRQALSRAMEQRTPEEERVAREADLLLQFSTGQIEKGLTAEERVRYEQLKKRLAEFEKTTPDPPQTLAFFSPVTSPHTATVLPMKGFYPLPFEPAVLARTRSYLLAAGDVHRPTAPLDAGWPEVLGPTGKDRSRRALADWICSQPLTARVYVNRVWQQHFGRGIVATPSDFGIRGAEPTHPELLDWLAAEFLRSGGSTKHLHRLLVTSAVYRQTAARPQAADEDNRLLSRWQPRRLEAEAVRDSYLAVSGELDATIGGASSAADDKARRRSLYLLQKRDTPPYAQALFDGPTAMTESCARRQVTTVALQPLYLLNSDFSVRRAEALAVRVAERTRGAQVAEAYRLTLGRLPDAAETELGERFLAGFEQQPQRGLLQFCQALMNLNEFLYLE